jgi:hypothetical protein
LCPARLSGGAIAGIVIACVIVVAAGVGAAVYFLIIKPKRDCTGGRIPRRIAAPGCVKPALHELPALPMAQTNSRSNWQYIIDSDEAGASSHCEG